MWMCGTEFVLGNAMENSIFNCLMANIVGTGNQFLPQNDANVAEQGQNGFFALFSEKMGGIFGAMLPQSVDAVSLNAGTAQEKGTPVEGSEMSSDRSQISLFVSSLIAAIEQPGAQSLPEDTDLSAITGFLKNILEVLSAGDEVELKPADEDVSDTASSPGKDKGSKDVDDKTACSFAGPLAVFLAALSKISREDAGPGQGQGRGQGAQDMPDARQIERTTQPIEKNVPHAAKGATPDVNPAPDADAVPLAQAEAPEEQAETRPLLVEVTKSAKDNKVIDISINDMQKKSAFSVPVESKEQRTEGISDRFDAQIKDRTDADRIVIQVAEKEDPDLRNDADDRSANENGIGLHGNSQRNNEHGKPEVHHAAKNDFGAMMVEKIEKIAEQYSGKNLGMDMTVKLKIGDNETILVGLRDEGASVTVEVKAANENTMNFIQSQKDDLMKNLEDKHIMTTIHVDIDQDAQGRQQDGRRRERDQDGAEEGQDFGAFFEAMA